MNKLSIALSLAASLALSACGKDVTTPYGAAPDKPLIDVGGNNGNRERDADGDLPTDFCKKDANGVYPNGVNLTSGEADGRLWGRGQGCIHRNIKDVWAASLNQPLMVWDGVDQSNAEKRAVPENVALYYRVQYIVKNFITVRWAMDWYHSVTEGTVQDPQKILVNYKKVEGTSHIAFWQGNFILEKVNDNITSFVMANQIDASRTNEEDARGAVRDVYNKISTGAPARDQLPE